jgi:hypothetical protein
LKRKLFTHLVVSSIVALFLLVACSSDQGATHAALADGCYINTDCNSPLVCAFRRCHAECTTDRDCPGGARCVLSDRPFHVCQLGVEKNCTYNSDCPTGQVCGVDQNCRDQCKTDSDCVSGQVCSQGTCADPSELNNGKLPVSAGTGGGDAASSAGQSCVYNSDCPTSLICLNQVCVVECKQDVDCLSKGAGYQCIKSQCVAGTSQLPDAGAPDATLQDGGGQEGGKGCTYNSDCTPQICRNGTCIDQCHADVDCPAGESCNSSHVCTLPEASVPTDAPTGYGGGCVYTSDCNSTLLICKSGICAYECNGNLDCDPGHYCNANHQCIFGAPPPADAGATDAGAADALAEAGKACSDNASCSDGLWCNGDEQCILGHCYPAADTPCNSHATCVQDSCTEATRSCTHTTLGATDADGDGHYDQACGGDDCNDRDKTIYAGHPELCDNKDNDCNGLVDDYAVVARGTEYTSIVGAPGGTWAIPNVGVSQLMTSAFGTGFMTARLGNPNYYVRTMTTGGVAGTDTALFGVGAYYSSHVAGFGANTASTPSAILVYENDNGGGYSDPLYAVVVNPVTVDGGTSFGYTTPVNLVGTGVPWAAGQWANEADIDWTGSAFLVTWSRYNTATSQVNGYFTTLNTDGTQATSTVAVPTPAVDGGAPTGNLGNPSTSNVVLRSAANGSVFAFVYGQWTSYYTAANATVYFTSASGTTLAGPATVPGFPLDIVAYGSGFVALSQTGTTLVMTELSDLGAVLNTVSTTALGSSSGLVAMDARGAVDPNGGIAFALKMSAGVNSATNGTIRLVRARHNTGGTFDPMEIQTPMNLATANTDDRIDLSVLSDGTLGISYWEPGVDNAVHVRIASCLP